MGNLVRLITQDGSMVCTVIDSTAIVSEMERIHQPSATVTAALGRLITAASMIGRGIKFEAGSVTMRIAGDGPAGTLIAVSDAAGNPRGYVANSIVEIPLNSFGKLDVAGAVGSKGMLSVIKDVGLPEPSTGSVPLVSGEIAEDVTGYFMASEQLPTVCALGVLVNPELSVRAAGGYLVQLLPGAAEESIACLEKNVKNTPPISTLIDSGITPIEIAQQLLAGLQPELLDECEAAYRCDCSLARVQRALCSIGKEELTQMIAEQETTEVCCHFCDKKYCFTSEELRALL